jgi:hypothetical protein
MRNAMEWLRLALLTGAACFIAFKTTASAADAAVMLALLSPLVAFKY